jgi:hypothetical protein
MAILLQAAGMVLFGRVPEALHRRRLDESNVANSTIVDGAVAIICPESVFATVDPTPGNFILMLISIVASLPVMAFGL